MKVLVTGAAGQLGRALIASASAAGFDAHPVDRAGLDIADPDAVAALLDTLRPAAIVNAAAYTAVDRAETDAPAAYRTNRDGPAALAQAAAQRGLKLVHVSTDFVFDGTRGVPYGPTDPTSPLGVYGASKLAGEQAILATLPEALIVRTAWVYGADGGNFMNTMLRLMRTMPALRVVADQIGTPTHTVSLAGAIWKLLRSGASGIHHFTDAGVASWYDFAVAIQEEALAAGLLGQPVPVTPIRTDDYPTPARRPAYSVLDKTSTYAELGEPARHWRDELRAALDQLRNRRD